MGILCNDSSREVFRLSGRSLIGRAPTAAIRLSEREVSGEHASVWWDGADWRIRDLGSSNGTWVDGVPLGAGQTAVLKQGSKVGFGSQEATWGLVDAGPPCIAASHGKVVRSGEPDLLVLPSEEDPRFSVLASGGEWFLEGPDGTHKVQSGDVVVVDGVGWTLHLPVAVEQTWTRGKRMTLSECTLVFAVSRDEETVNLKLVAEGFEVDLGARAHHYLLLILARQRLADAGGTEAECGWVMSELLQRDLALSELALNVQVHRARKAVAKRGVEGSGSLVERRMGTGQLRLGVAAVQMVVGSAGVP